MADCVTIQSSAPATPAAGTVIATRITTYGGVTSAEIAPVGVVLFSGADGSKTATDVSDTAPIPIKQVAGTAACSNVAGNASSVTLLSATSGRLGAHLYNDSTSDVYVKFGITASASSFTKRMLPNDYWEISKYSGRIDAIWTVANGNMRITELTA